MTLLEKLAAAGFNDWDSIISAEPGALTSDPDCVRTADGIATLHAMISGYCDVRRAGFDHENALKHAHKRAQRVRKALGYTYP